MAPGSNLLPWVVGAWNMPLNSSLLCFYELQGLESKKEFENQKQQPNELSPDPQWAMWGLAAGPVQWLEPPGSYWALALASGLTNMTWSLGGWKVGGGDQEG